MGFLRASVLFLTYRIGWRSRALVHIEDGNIDNQQRLGRLCLVPCTASSSAYQRSLYHSHDVVMPLILWLMNSNFGDLWAILTLGETHMGTAHPGAICEGSKISSRAKPVQCQHTLESNDVPPEHLNCR